MTSGTHARQEETLAKALTEWAGHRVSAGAREATFLRCELFGHSDFETLSDAVLPRPTLTNVDDFRAILVIGRAPHESAAT